MSLNEETQATSESFWEVGQYKRTVRRVDDGPKLCNELIGLIKERGDIEAGYAKQLRNWGRKWQEAIEKGPEYGTTERAWKGVLEEADKQADIHNRIKDRLNEEVGNTIKTWMKGHYHNKPLVGLKESKDLDEEFRKVQKPWAKLYVKVEKSRKDYHAACKAERSAQNHEKNAHGDSSLSIDQQKKLVEKVDKCREEKEKCREVYEAALKELNRNNSKYMEDMELVFAKAQAMEADRLKFFKEMLFGVHRCLDLSQDSKLTEIYKAYWSEVEKADARSDLEWWARHHGTGMPMNWPVFEEYQEDFRRIHQAEGRNARSHIAAHTIVLKAHKAKEFQNELSEYSPELRRINKARAKDVPTDNGIMLIGQRTAPDASPTSSLATHSSGNSNHSNHNGNTHPSIPNEVSRGGSEVSEQPSSPSPFENDWDAAPEQPPYLVDHGEPGVKVIALYDYEPLEPDEMALKKGEEFEKLEEEDEQGWCKGRKDGRIGLYPANYASPAS